MRAFRAGVLWVVAAAGVMAQIPGAGPWTLPPGDPTPAMVDGMAKYLTGLRGALPAVRRGSVESLRRMLGVVDPRVSPPGPGEHFGAEAARWPVLDGVTAEGLLLRARGLGAVA